MGACICNTGYKGDNCEEGKNNFYQEKMKKVNQQPGIGSSSLTCADPVDTAQFFITEMLQFGEDINVNINNYLPLTFTLETERSMPFVVIV